LQDASVTSKTVSKSSNMKPAKGFAEGDRVSFSNSFFSKRVIGEITDIQDINGLKIYTILGDNPKTEYPNISEDRLRHEGPAAVVPAVNDAKASRFSSSNTKKPSKQTEIVANQNADTSAVKSNQFNNDSMPSWAYNH
jgi:hypothetical protein